MSKWFATFCASTVFCLSVGAACAQTVTVRFNLWLPPKHFIVTDIVGGWAAEVARVTEGRVKIENTTASLGAPSRQYQIAADGIADLTWASSGLLAGKFPLQEVMNLPFLGQSAEAASVALWRTYKKHLESKGEYADVKLLGLHAQAPGALLLVKARKVEKVADLHGLKVRAAPEMVPIANAMNMTPIALPATEIYPAASKGIIDAMFFSAENIAAFNLQNYVKTILSIPGGFYNASFFLVMNKDTWNKISPQDQAAIEAISGEAFARRSGQIWDQQAGKAEQQVRNSGVPMLVANEAFVNDLKSRSANVEAAWVSKANAMGLDGAGILKDLRAEMAKISANK